MTLSCSACSAYEGAVQRLRSSSLGGLDGLRVASRGLRAALRGLPLAGRWSNGKAGFEGDLDGINGIDMGFRWDY